MGAEAELVRPRLARGCRCFAVMIDGAIAGYGWLSTGPEWIGELQVEIRPRKAEAYIWNCVTLTQHRRKGVFRALVVGICELARQTGVRRVWIGSVAVPGERALPESGFQPAVRFTTVRLLGLYTTKPAFEASNVGEDARKVLQPSGTQGGAIIRRKH